jgi:hypothetical protein
MAPLASESEGERLEAKEMFRYHSSPETLAGAKARKPCFPVMYWERKVDFVARWHFATL